MNKLLDWIGGMLLMIVVCLLLALLLVLVLALLLAWVFPVVAACVWSWWWLLAEVPIVAMYVWVWRSAQTPSAKAIMKGDEYADEKEEETN